MTLRNLENATDFRRIESGPVLLTGLQAFVRLLLLQAERDRREGLHTAGFVSGYRGSPLGGLDIELGRAAAELDASRIRFEPGLNEELAATSIWGSQQANLFGDARFDGVFGLWYGKGPGVDRSADAIKHGNAAGVSQFGGVLVAAGDDHACRSSTIVQQSEFAFIDAMMPVLYPADVHDILELGLYGYALSRYCGCWVGFIVTQDTADATQSVDLSADRFDVSEPARDLPGGGVHIRWPDSPLAQEDRLHTLRLPAALEFARANPLNRVVWDAPDARIGIVTAGKAYGDVMHALDRLGIDADRAMTLGLRVLKLGMTWPLEPTAIAAFAEGLEEIIVVEEKRAIVEPQIKEQLFDGQCAAAPRIVGKRDEHGSELLPATGELTTVLVERALAKRLQRLDAGGVLRQRREALARPEAAPLTLVEGGGRLPHFCSGCPHNTSTRVPEGSRAAAGIGCHFMALWMDRSTVTFTQMGGEGATWIGQAPFVTTGHMFQNLGDGTYTHSGLLAIRAAVAAGVNITYKILYNDAVAMTGGQAVEGGFSPAQIAQQLVAEGVGPVVILADHPGRYATRAGLPAGVNVFARELLDTIQRQLREHEGVSALIFDQACAAETRRKRKRGLLPTPARRVEINALVCEGCGDCNVQSNCLSVVALETELGRKRAIDQSACNRDYSCLQGFCPSFVTVSGGEPRPRRLELPTDLPPPPAPRDAQCNVVIAGVGGTGVVTAGHVLGAAAHLEGRSVLELEQTGLAQKFGAVLSHIRIAARDGSIAGGPRVADGEADLLLACDLLVAAADSTLSHLSPAKSVVIANAHHGLPPAFIHDRDLEYPVQALLAALRDRSARDTLTIFDATRYATELLGDAMLANIVMLGAALQLGLLPVSLAALDRVFDRLGKRADDNRAALALGRFCAHAPQSVEKLCRQRRADSEPLTDLDAIVEYRAAYLSDYQDRAYAARYRELVDRTRRAEEAVCPGHTALARAVAREYFRLLAYKDEYEVARLYTESGFLDELSADYEGRVQISFHFAPPFLAGRDAAGRPRKREFGPWIVPVLKLLAQGRVLRGGRLDIFGYTRERRLERALIAEYEHTLKQVLDELDERRMPIAVTLAEWPKEIRGFGPVKAAAADRAREHRGELLADWQGAHAAEGPVASARRA